MTGKSDWFELLQYSDELDVLTPGKRKWALNCEKHQRDHPDW